MCCDGWQRDTEQDKCGRPLCGRTGLPHNTGRSIPITHHKSITAVDTIPWLNTCGKCRWKYDLAVCWMIGVWCGRVNIAEHQSVSIYNNGNWSQPYNLHHDYATAWKRFHRYKSQKLWRGMCIAHVVLYKISIINFVQLNDRTIEGIYHLLWSKEDTLFKVSDDADKQCAMCAITQWTT